MSVTIHHADAVQWAREYQGEKFHALFCDPPYALTDPRDPRRASPSASQRENRSAARGFMGKRWDNEIAFSPDTWAAFASVLHDGAFIFAFASSRGWHRQAVAMEDAGLVIHPSIFGLRMLGYTFGSGFPKSTRVKDAPAFNGHRYGLQALKPALEPIIVAQKPYKGKPVACITATGAGALNIDASRIAGDTGERNEETCDISGYGLADRDRPHFRWFKRGGGHTAGRWPAHFYVDEQGAAALDAQSGELKPATSRTNGNGKTTGNFIASDNTYAGTVYQDGTTGASRFFFNAVADQIDDADAVMYCAKASRRERDAGLDGMPLRERGQKYGLDAGGDLPQQTPHKHEPTRNPHPTLKPISLTRWLATLLLPPAEYAPRRLFVPFAGAGSECIGAALAGWDEVVGVEMMNDEEHPYVDIARARVAHWLKQPSLIGGAS